MREIASVLRLGLALVAAWWIVTHWGLVVPVLHVLAIAVGLVVLLIFVIFGG